MRKSYKIVTLGQFGTGKSSMINRYIKETFSEIEVSTIGAAFQIKYVKFPDNSRMRLDLWDCSGQERFDCVTPIYYRSANGCIIVYEICSRNSYEKAQSWVDTILEYDQKNQMIIALVGNKCDITDQREIDKKEAAKYANQNKLLFAEVSAKSGENIEEFFNQFVTALIHKVPDDIEETAIMNIENPEKPRNACCVYLPLS